MARRTLPALFRSWAFNSRNLGRRHRDAVVLGLETFEDRVVPATIPTPTVDSSLAALPRVDPVQGDSSTPIDFINPQVVADPTDPLRQVLVATAVNPGSVLAGVYSYTTNGGASWSDAEVFQSRRDPMLPANTNPNANYTHTSSPAVAFGRDGTIYFVYLAHNAAKTSGALLFTRVAFNGIVPVTPTVLYQWTGADPALNPTIGVDNNLPTYTDPVTGAVFTDTLTTRTVGRQSVYVAWNGNAANAADVITSGGVLFFNPNPIMAAVSADNGDTWSNPTPVTDGGYLGSALNLPADQRAAAPQVAFSPGNSGAPGSLVFAWPRQVRGQNYSEIVYEATRPDGGNAGVLLPQAYSFTGNFGLAAGPVPDATAFVAPATSDTQSSRTYQIVIPAGTVADPAFVLRDLSINLSIVSPFLDHLRVELIAPNGTTTLVLFNNRTRGDNTANPTPGGQPFPTGISVALPGYNAGANPLPANGGLGVINDTANTRAVFSDTAARRINDPASAYPFIGAYRPEGNAGYQREFAPTALIAQFLANAGLTGAGAAALNGSTWGIRITDFRDDRLQRGGGNFEADQFLQSFGLTFSSVADGFGTDTAITGSRAPAIGADFNTAPLTGASGVYPAVSPTAGVAPSVSLAFDTSLGATAVSPFGGSLYVSYTRAVLDTANPPRVVDTNVHVARSTLSPGGALTLVSDIQVNDDRATDNWTEGNRPQFTPAVTVDPTTGTVVATWYDARLDANRTRAATFIATSIDGGATWSDQTLTTAETADTRTSPFLNEPKDAIDFVTGTRYTLQPVPTNVAQAGAFGVGIRQSVVAFGGQVYAYWAGNLNAAGAGILSGRARFAGGPRVVSGDTGVILSASNSGAGSYNTAVAPDGTRGIDGFVVTFDRMVSTVPVGHPEFAGSALNPANYVIRYHNPYDAVGIDTVFSPTSVTPAGGFSFLIRFPARFEVGTYSYSVSNVRDRVRWVDPVGGGVVVGNPMDQDADAFGGEAAFDSFAMPTPVSGVPFTFPYVPLSLPLIIPGPYMVGSSVPNRSAADEDLVNAGVATAVDVRFDRDMNVNPAAGPVFSRTNVVRITGPAGVLYDRSAFSGAAATAAVSGGQITGVTVTNGGGGYPAAPTVVITGTGTGATAQATVVNGVVTAVTILNPGTGYTIPPTVTFLHPISVTQPNAADPRTFRIGFPPQVLSGTYTVEVDAQFSGAVGLGAGRPVLVDSNQNAGVGVLRGGDPTAGVATNSNYSASFAGAAATIPASVGGVPGQATFPLTVPDAFAIALSNGHVPSILLNVSSTAAVNNRVIDLIGELVAPDGTVIRLFTNVGATGRPLGTQWFANTTLIDTALSPIQGGFQPFSAGPYTPQFPLSDLAGKVSNGTWQLRITNIGGEAPRLNAWSLSLPQISGGTGLGQDAADRFAVSFRVFNQDPTDPLTQKTWTAVGPAAENGQGNSSRTNALAVDPSDPSGNTVYLGGASGGVWKTNNFLTMSGGGPTWVPLTDSGPSYSLNVVSIALFPRNNDPNQTIVFAVTGEGDTGTPGVGILRSMDAGRTWNVLDSLNNADVGGFGGNLTPITSPTRDRTFFGKTAFEIIVDPTPSADAERNVIVYAAFGGGNGGVYRSVDTGRHWTLMRAGNATDIVLAEGSGAVGTGQLQILYAAFRGEGVYRANPAFVAGGMVALTGTPPGNGSFVDGDTTLADRVEINAPTDLPNGAKGRILLATPARTNNRAWDLNYQGWLYALVVAANDSFDGLYVTKDFGLNWTNVGLPELLTPATGIPTSGFGTNNYTRNDHDVFASPPGSVGALPGQGNYDVGFAIDPLNPNVVYIGGTNNNAIGPNGAMIRVDTTGLLDANAVVAYDNSLPDGGTVQYTIGTGNVSTKPANTQSETAPVVDLGPGQPYGFTFPAMTGTNTGYLNVLRDPTNPFSTSSTILAFRNVDRILNTGRGARYSGFYAEVNTDVHRIITVVDPLTGGTRLLVGDDQGVATAVDDGKGNLITSVGSGPQRQNLPGLIRNGNLQTVQFYSSAVQPGQLAAEIAGAMFYGEAQDNGFPVSNPDILLSGVGTVPGTISWSGGTGDGTWGLTDQTGTGTYYDYKWPCCGGGGEQFFQVNGSGRTFGLTQANDNPTVGTGNWPLLGGSKFTVNPIDANGILMSSSRTGRLFRTVDQGVTWFQIAGPDPGPTPNNFTLFQNLGGYAPAVAFGAPDTNQTQAQFNNFLYAGVGGTVWVSFNGGTTWTSISAGLSGGVQQIVPDPARGSKAVYAVTNTGVFFKADASTAAAWVNITGNIFSVTDPIFSDPNAAPQTGLPATLRGLTALAVDWRYAIPDTRPGAPSAFFPILYAGGDGGIVRSLDRGQTWQIYPVGSNHTTDYVDQTTGQPGTVVTAIPAGGYFPSTQITQLSLSFGNIDPTTGLPLQQTGGLNMLTAATYGRGTWVIRLEDLRTNPNPAIAALADFQVIQQSGPKVIGVGGTAAPNQFFVEFDAPVLASTFTTADFRMTDSAGNPLRVVSVQALFNNTPPVGGPALPVAALDYHNLFLVTVAPVAPVVAIAPGFARVTIGPDAANPGRASIADYAGFGMNQDGDNRNGETTADPNNGGAAADAYNGFVFIPGAAVFGNLHLSMPVVATAGDPTQVTVTAVNPNTGLPDTGYRGTVHFDVTNDPLLAASGLPADYTFTASDNGVHSFTIIFKTATAPSGPLAPQTLLSVSDTLNAINPAQAAITVNPNIATHFRVAGFPDPTVAGVAGTVTVTALDLFDNVDPTYTGTVTFTSTDVGMSTVLPATYTFTSGMGAGFDNGVHVFTDELTLTTAGLQTITATDATNPNRTLTGEQTVLVVPAAPATVLLSGLPATTVAGTALTVMVRLEDEFGNLATNYTGTVSFTSTDTGVSTVLPPTYTFTSGMGPGFDNGIHTFTGGITLTTVRTTAPGTQSITVTTGTTPAVSATQAVQVTPAAPAQVLVTGFPNPVTAGTTGSVTVTLRDQFNNLATNYTGMVSFSSTDVGASTVVPPTYTFTSGPGRDNGVHVFTNGVRLTTAGLQSITVTTGAATGSQTNIQVNAAAATTLAVTGFPASVVAGTPGSVTVTLRDQFGNLATGFRGAVTFTSTDLGASTVLPPTYTFTAGDGGVRTFTNGVRLTTATGTATFPGTHTITATAGALTGNQSGIVVTPAATDRYTVTGFPSPATAGTTGSVTVTARDQYGNVTPAYTGTVHFTSTDAGPMSFFPADYTFTAGDAGVHTFTNGVRLTIAGTQSITATDTANALITGSQSAIQVTADVADSLTVTGFPASVVAGTPGSVTVTLRDQFGNLATGFRGAVTFTSTDLGASTVLPPTYTFTAGDGGVRTFTNGVRLTTATGTATFPGTHTITATAGALTGSQSGIVVTPAATSQFVVAGHPSPVAAGAPGTVTVTARDQFGNLTPAYAGTVRFTSTDVKASTVLPPDYTFVPGTDAGVHTFTNGVTLTTSGTQSITATDTASAAVTGSQTGIVVTPGAATQLTVTGFPATVTAGVLGSVTVALLDQFGNLATGYTGTVSFTSTDPAVTAAVPAAYTFTAGDGGTHTFTNGVRLTTATGTATFPGTHTITATDGSLTGAQSGIVVTPAAPAQVAVTGFPATVVAGTPGSVTVTLQDQFGNLATNYTGTVSLTSTDTGASTVLPPVYTFTGADAGVHTFTNGVTLTTAGTQSITATAGAAVGSQTGITVTPDVASRFDVGGFPSSVTAGTPGTVTVTARDQFGNLTPAYAGTVTFASTDVGTNTALPTPYTFVPGTDAGVHTFTNGVTLTTAGTQSITAADGAITGTQAGILVTPDVVATAAVTGFPATITAGVPGSVTVTLRDQFGNLATNYTGTVSLTSTDTGASTVLPPVYTFTGADAGVHTFTNGVTLTTAGTQSITATAGAAVGSQTGITVTPDVASRFDVGGFPSPVVAGTPGTLTVTARDRFGNVATGYTGTVRFSSNDTGAGTVLPGNYPFTALDAGVHAFPGVQLTTVGTRSITAADTVTAAVAGTQAGIVVTPAAAASLAVTGFPAAITAGTPGSVTVTLRDQFGNLATGFTGTVTFASSDANPATVLPAAYTFTAGDGGVHTFTNGVRLTTVGTQSITATSGALAGSQTGIAVTPAGAARLVIGGLPARVAAGTRATVTVTALDAFGNVATGYGGPLAVTSSDARAQFPTSVGLTAGVGSFDAVFNTRSTQTVTLADPGNGALAAQATTDVFFNLAQTFSVGGGTGGSQTVFEYDGTGNPTASFPNRYGGGSRVVSADFNGDGVPDLAVGTGPGIPSDITVFDGRTKSILFTVNPFAGFTGGVFLAAGHVSGTDRPELIVTPDQGGGPRVQVYAGGTFNKIADFFGIEDPNFRGGARAAAGDIDGDGFAEVVVSAGFQGGPRISVYDGAALAGGRIVHPMSDFFAFEDTLRNGAFVAVGDVNGDGFGDMIFGAGPGGGPRVLVVSGQTVMSSGADAAIRAPVANLFAGNTNNRGGVRVTAKNLDGDGFADVVVGDGEGAGSTVTAYPGAALSANRADPLFAFDAFPGINAGVFVG